MEKYNTPILVSACLVGLCTRYDATVKPVSEEFQSILDNDQTWIPVCPEQLGGLPTPRDAADIQGGDGRDVLQLRAKVVTKQGKDLTTKFISGAKQVLTIAIQQNVKTVYLKARSPSCAVKGTIGVTAALLSDNGIEVFEI